MVPTEAGLRPQLIDAALDLLERDQGDISLRAVARAAGVSAMAPYRHFADKAALLGAAAERGFLLLHDRLAAADRRDLPADALVAQGLAYIAFAQERPALFRLMFAGPAHATIEEKTAASGYSVLAARVAGMMPAVSEPAALACWGLVHGLATLALDRRLPVDPAVHAGVLRLFVGGLVREAAAVQ